MSGYSGVDFSTYRDTTIRRRIMRRMMLQAKESFGDYAALLDKTPGEVEALYNDILINVTAFFRDPQVFKSLAAEVFPEIMKDRKVDNPVRVWVPGCSTGQEPYSLAMALLEFMEKTGKHAPIQIFATDLDMAALQRGREGIYPENIETEVSPERLKRFSRWRTASYRISRNCAISAPLRSRTWRPTRPFHAWTSSAAGTSSFIFRFRCSAASFRRSIIH